MSFIRRIFTSKYKKLLDKIKEAEQNEQSLRLPNGVELNFAPGYEYDKCCNYVLPHSPDVNFYEKYSSKIGQTINLAVYDSFCGDVVVLAVGRDRVLVEIVSVTTCYQWQTPPAVGSKYWIGEWEISEFSPKDLPFYEKDDNLLPF